MKPIKNDPATYRTRASLAAAKKKFASGPMPMRASEEILSILREADPLGYVALPQSTHPGHLQQKNRAISFNQKLLALKGG